MDNTNLHVRRISPDAWHYHVYRWWRARTTADLSGRQETLCHYFWIPVRAFFIWFFRCRVLGSWKPSELTFMTSIIVTAVTLCVAIPMVGATVGFLSILIFTLVMLFVLMKAIYDRFTRTIDFIMLWGTLPLWIIPVAVFLTWKWITDTFDLPHGIELLEWFLFRRWYIFMPWNVMLTGIIVGSTAVIGWHNTWLAIRITLATIVIGTMIVLGVCIPFAAFQGIKYLVNRAADRRHAKRLVQRQAEGDRVQPLPTVSTVQLVAQYIKTKKEGSIICPLLIMPEDPDRS